MFLDSKKGQVGLGPIFVAVAVLGLVLGFIIFVLLLPLIGSFIDMGVESSEEHSDPVTSFIIKSIPFWIVLIFFAMLVYFVASGGGR